MLTTTSLWFIAALVVLGAELMLGTVYLLAAALGLAAGGLASWAGLDFTVQCLAVGLVTIAGCLVARTMRKKNAKGEAEALQSIDEGREVDVGEVAADGSAQVLYRGARWRARAKTGELTVGRWRIERVDGTRTLPAIEQLPDLVQIVAYLVKIHNFAKTCSTFKVKYFL